MGTSARVSGLYQAWNGAIYARCRGILRDAQAAEDATQEVFIRALLHEDRIPARDDELRWLLCVARNYCLNEVRDRALRPGCDGDGLEGVMPVSLDKQVAARDAVRLVSAQIPGKLREVAWLHYVDGLSQAETASSLGLSRRTVVYWLRAFRQRSHALLTAPACRPLAPLSLRDP